MPAIDRLGLEWLAALCMAALLLLPSHVEAGKGRDNCVGWIDSLPAQLTRSGTWCMRADLTTTLESGGGIQVNGPNNVVIDCNGYRIKNAMPGNRAVGVSVIGTNHIVRNCDVRGYFVGIIMSGASNTIEDNRLQDIGHVGIQVDPRTTIRRNHILRVGGDATFEGHIAGIVGGGDITDNVIDTIFANAEVNRHGFVSGISTRGGSGVVTRNRIRNLWPAGTGTSIGIEADNGYSYVTFNHIVGPALNKAGHLSIHCTGGESYARDNIANGFGYIVVSGNTTTRYGSIICNNAGGTNIDKI